MKKKMTVLVAVLGLLAISGLASAATDEDDGDTTFNFGYDEQYRILVWGTSDSDGLYDCALDGEYDVTYGDVEDDIIEIPVLEEDGVVVSFPANMQDDLAEGLTAAEGPIDYSGSDGDCGVVGTSVEGPNGQVNHGMFMKYFNHVYEGTGRGCLVRHLAQSDLGKKANDQQINVPDVDPDAPDVEDQEEPSTVDFSTVLADCEHGNDDVNGNGNGNGNGKGRPDNPGAHGREKANQAKSNAGGPGNSENAPGRNK